MFILLGMNPISSPFLTPPPPKIIKEKDSILMEPDFFVVCMNCIPSFNC